MMGIFKEWEEEISKKIKQGIDGKKEIEKIPAVVKRCPKCYSLSLEYDPKTGKIFCTKCGFQYNLPKMK